MIQFGCPRIKDPNDPWYGLTPGHSIPSGHPASGESTPRPPSTPRREEPFQAFKGIEELDPSPVEATGLGPSRYTGTPSGILLHTPMHGPGASLEELQLKEILCDPANYQEDLPRVYKKLNVYCNLR